jgi:hypothetical protein
VASTASVCRSPAAEEQPPNQSNHPNGGIGQYGTTRRKSPHQTEQDQREIWTPSQNKEIRVGGNSSLNEGNPSTPPRREPGRITHQRERSNRPTSVVPAAGSPAWRRGGWRIQRRARVVGVGEKGPAALCCARD